MSFLCFCKVQLYFFSIHEWEQPNSQFGMSKARQHLVDFARLNYFFHEFMSGSSQIHDLECQKLDVIALFLQGSIFFGQNSRVGA